MKESPCVTPVLFLVFNRPDTTARVFERIRSVRPSRLYVAADGPRADRVGEAEACQKVREIFDGIDWPCRVDYLFQDRNLGCKIAVSTGISWFFENEEAGIILEDDCMPDPSFFQYCAKLLERFRDDDRVGMIAGTNYLGESETQYCYFFSHHCPIWGWATWRRAWRRYDLVMSAWNEFKDENYMLMSFTDNEIRNFFSSVYDSVADNKIDTWDHQWSFTCRKESMLTAIPRRNLVTNIGFSSEATHTKAATSPFAGQPSFSLEMANFSHPRIFLPNPELEQKISAYILSAMGWTRPVPKKKSFPRRVLEWLRT